MNNQDAYWREEYFKWMVSEVLDARLRENYSILMNTLYDIEYKPLTNGDQNRVQDALYMRECWLSDNGITLEDCYRKFYCGEKSTCSVLELLVSFAKRIDKEWISSDNEDHPEVIFALFLENLGLDTCTDARIARFGLWLIRDIVNRWMDGKISRNGEGGLFPLYKRTSTDQRGKELWSQMMPWISENFG